MSEKPWNTKNFFLLNDFLVFVRMPFFSFYNHFVILIFINNKSFAFFNFLNKFKLSSLNTLRLHPLILLIIHLLLTLCKTLLILKFMLSKYINELRKITIVHVIYILQRIIFLIIQIEISSKIKCDRRIYEWEFIVLSSLFNYFIQFFFVYINNVLFSVLEIL